MERWDAYSLNFAFLRRCASSQSRTAVHFDIMSPHPDASSLWGAWDMIIVSATTATGGSASMEADMEFLVIDARDDTIPSCEAAVGTLIKLLFIR